MLDEVSSGLEFDRRWSAFRDALLEDPSVERSILLLLATGVKHDTLRLLAMAFDDNWDLVEERVPVDEPEPPDVRLLLPPVLGRDPRHLATCAISAPTTTTSCWRASSYSPPTPRSSSTPSTTSPWSNCCPTGRRPNLSVGNSGSSKSWPDVNAVRARVDGPSA